MKKNRTKMMLLSLSDGLATSVPFRNKRYQVVVQQPPGAPQRRCASLARQARWAWTIG